MRRSIFDFATQQQQLNDYEAQMAEPEFWSSDGKADVIQTVKQLKLLIEPWQVIGQELQDLQEFYEFLQEQADDESEEMIGDVERDLQVLVKSVEQEELKVMLGNEEDVCNAFLAINAGAGGTESCDWASMLLRMYQRWAEKKGFTVKTVDLLPGEEAGVKNVIILIEGPYAFGYLKSERGVHRLVRISPFDSNKRRHTSFASVDITPEIDENINIDVDENDLKIDTYRAGGAGGQHVNKTDSAVRITHVSTGIVVQCQNERSQHKNKASAMKMMKSKLYEKELQDRREKQEASYSEKSEIAWGNQIRSYVYQPYTMVKDHQTNYQSGNVLGVMDGDLDPFIEAYLKHKT